MLVLEIKNSFLPYLKRGNYKYKNRRFGAGVYLNGRVLA
jgi:hypothetical protein